MSHQSRRKFIKSAAKVSAAVISAPFVHTSHAAGSLSVGLWDHWVPGANQATTDLINQWAAKEKVDVKIDYITSQGNKLLLTTAAEAQANRGMTSWPCPLGCRPTTANCWNRSTTSWVT